jgi:hypothetical protein
LPSLGKAVNPREGFVVAHRPGRDRPAFRLRTPAAPVIRLCDAAGRVVFPPPCAARMPDLDDSTC